jgi:hypothetical protein
MPIFAYMPSGIQFTQPIPTPLPSNMAYGSFFDTTIQSIPAPFTLQTIDINSTSLSSGVTLGTNQLVLNNAGVYNVQFSLQVTNNDMQDHLFYVWFAQNGFDIADSTSIISVPRTHGGSNGHIVISLNIFVQANAFDAIELRWTSDNIAVQIETIATLLPIPAVPSVIITANQIA